MEAAEQMDTRITEAVGGGAEAVLSLPSNYHGVINVSAINTCNSSSIITVAINIENDDEVIITNSKPFHDNSWPKNYVLHRYNTLSAGSDAHCKTHLQQQDRFASGKSIYYTSTSFVY